VVALVVIFYLPEVMNRDEDKIAVVVKARPPSWEIMESIWKEIIISRKY
jgi:hypothetical protein